MAGIKIVDLPPLGRDLASTDLLELSLAGGTGSRKITGQEIMNASKLSINNTPIINGTVGRVLFQGTGDVLQQSSSLFWDNTNARLGIGTSSPTSRLSVTNTASGEFIQTLKASGVPNPAFNIEDGDITIPDYSSFGFNPPLTSNTVSVISSLGGTIGGMQFSAFSANTDERAMFLTAFSGRTTATSNPVMTLRVAKHDGSTNATTLASGDIAFQFNNLTSPLIRVMGSGNVLIGTTTDAGFRLDVVGNARIQGSTTTSTSLTISGGFVMTEASNVHTFTAPATNRTIRFITNSQSFSLFPTGNFAINTTTDDGFRLDVNGTLRSLGFTLRTSTADHYATAFSTTTTDGTFNFRRGADNGWVRFTLGASSQFFMSGDTGTGELRVGAASGHFLTLYSGGSERIRLFNSTGNVGINTTTDAGFRLDVNGTARVKGTGATSATTAFTVQNSSGTTLMSVRDDSRIIMPVGGGGNVSIGSLNANTNAIDVRGYFSNGSNCGIYIENFNSGTIKTQLGGATNGILIDLTQSFSNGTRGGLGMVVTGTVNNTGTSVGSVAGYSFEPTITSLTGGSVLYAFNSTVGGAYINTSSRQSSSILQADSTTQGFLPPRMTQAQRNAIASPAIGLEIYQTDATEGKYIYKSSGWTYIG